MLPVFMLTASVLMPLFYSEQMYSELSRVPYRQVALVPGASVIRNRKPSTILMERLEKAIELYRNDRVAKLLLSGDNSKKYYDEVSTMKDYTLKKNVRGSDIFLDHAGLRTLDSIYRAKEIFRSRELVIITQRLYMPRALFIASELEIPAIGYTANTGRTETEITAYLREVLARSLAFIDIYILERQPEFLGRKTDISGDGRITWEKRLR